MDKIKVFYDAVTAMLNADEPEPEVEEEVIEEIPKPKKVKKKKPEQIFVMPKKD